jgi:SAM-dependent methyltransferase
MHQRYKTLGRSIIRSAATAVGRVLPLELRRSLVLSRAGRASRGGLEFALGMLHDLHRRDAGAFHRFLWSNHLGYAATYEVEQRFGASNLNPSRHILLQDIASYLRARGVDPHRNIGSVLDVGCSLGYLLRHVEVEACPSAEILHGFDIDEYAIKVGSAHLASLQSKAELFVGDMAAAARFIGGRSYDLILCCGVLMYSNEDSACETVRVMLSSANHLVGIIALADQANGGTAIGRSVTRASDGAFVHDVHQMVQRAGGTVVSSRSIESEVSGSSPSYAILAEPPAMRSPSR